MEEKNKVIETELFDLKEEHNNNNRKRKNNKFIIYVMLGILLLIVVSIVIILLLNKEGTSTNENNNEDNNEKVVNKEDIEDNIAYVSCDDNTSLLNVRNSTNGDIIDGLSCFMRVTIEEELEETDNCSKWYKISYAKRGREYTGYACATYIKQVSIKNSDIELVEKLMNKANDYYGNNIFKAYCGDTTNETIEVKYPLGEVNLTGEYIKSKYKTLDELKEYLLSFLDENLINPELKLSDINNKNINDDYYEIDGNLYCRNYSANGILTRYTNNYNIEITNISDNKITGRVSYEYLKEESSCDINNLSKCSNSNFEYVIKEFTIKMVDNNYILTKIGFNN